METSVAGPKQHGSLLWPQLAPYWLPKEGAASPLGRTHLGVSRRKLVLGDMADFFIFHFLRERHTI